MRGCVAVIENACRHRYSSDLADHCREYDFRAAAVRRISPFESIDRLRRHCFHDLSAGVGYCEESVFDAPFDYALPVFTGKSNGKPDAVVRLADLIEQLAGSRIERAVPVAT